MAGESQTTDLIAAGLTWEPDPPQPGDAIALSLLVTNAGTTNLTNVTVDFVVNGAALSSHTIADIAAGTDASVTGAAWAVPVGSHVIEAIVDGQGNISESDEANNDLTRVLEAGPDLVVTDLRTVGDIVDGGSGAFEATVTNQGPHAFDGSASVRFLVDTIELGIVDIGSLAPGASTTAVSPNWTGASGDHQVRAEADPENSVPEVDEQNNGFETPVSVPAANEPEEEADGQPDLVVSVVFANPAAPKVGDNVRFAATVANHGNAVAAGFGVLFVLDGERFLGNEGISGLAPGETRTVPSGDWTASEGAHTLRVTVDPAQTIAELVEENNVGTMEVTIEPASPSSTDDTSHDDPATNEAPAANATADDTTGPLPDLYVEEGTWTRPLDAGSFVTYVATVRNQGNGTAGPFSVQFVLDDALMLGDVSVGEVPRGRAATVESRAWRATNGSHELALLIDPDDQVPETDDDNNRWNVSFELGVDEPIEQLSAGADLLVMGVVWSPDQPTEGDAVTFTATIANEGEAVDEPFAVLFAIDGGTTVSQHLVEGLPAGGQVRIASEPWNAVTGSFDLRVVLDPDGRIAELDDENNAQLTTLSIGPAEAVSPSRLGTVLVAALLLGALALGAAVYRRAE